MRFKAQIQNIATLTKFVASLSSLGPVAWVRMTQSEVRFTIIPEQGTQVWAQVLQTTNKFLGVDHKQCSFDRAFTVSSSELLPNESEQDSIFETYFIQSAANNVINLEVPLSSLHRALKSALNATAVSIRLTKKNSLPLISLTITNTYWASTSFNANTSSGNDNAHIQHNSAGGRMSTVPLARERETVIAQDVPVRVLSQHLVEGLHEPRCREPDVHIQLPPLSQIKSVSDRFTKLALAARSTHAVPSGIGPRLEMLANMHGCLRISVKTDAMDISSLWTGLQNPELDPSQVPGGLEALEQHPSTRMKAMGSADGTDDEGWARVRIDGRDWCKVLSVGRLGGRVIACFCHEHALILYVYLPNDSDNDAEESILTYYVSSYSG